MSGVYTEEQEKRAMERGLDDWGNWNCLRLIIHRLQHDILSFKATVKKLEEENATLRQRINVIQGEDAA